MFRNRKNDRSHSRDETCLWHWQYVPLASSSVVSPLDSSSSSFSRFKSTFTILSLFRSWPALYFAQTRFSNQPPLIFFPTFFLPSSPSTGSTLVQPFPSKRQKVMWVYQQSWAVSSVKQSISRVEQCIKLISTCLHQRLSPSLHRSSRHPSPTFIVNFLQVCKNRILSWWINLSPIGSL